MICIFSSFNDCSTTDVIKWLHHLGKKDVIKICSNEGSGHGAIKIDLRDGEFSFRLDQRTIHLNDIEAVWYRKGSNWLCDLFYPVKVAEHERFTDYLNYKLKTEEARLSEYLHYIIENTVPVLGSSTKGDLNKMLVLYAAKKVGLLIPKFYISNNKEGIGRVFDESPDLITKSMSDGLYLFDSVEKNTGYFSFTEKLERQAINNLTDCISPSFIQENIHKKYEVRVFFLADKCYSMAILSQTDEQTKIDFRKYNEKKPNRFVPFKLPDEIEQKIKKLFDRLELNTGSVDLMVDLDENLYFLEINPVGQFAMVSSPCNYFLEKKVALNLIQNARKYRPDPAS